MLLLYLLLLQSFELIYVLLYFHCSLHVLLVLAREGNIEAVSQVRGQICVICRIVSDAGVPLRLLLHLILLIMKVLELLLLSAGRPAELLSRVLNHLGFMIALLYHVMLLLTPCRRILMHLVHGLCLRARDLAELLLGALRHELVIQFFILERLVSSK